MREIHSPDKLLKKLLPPQIIKPGMRYVRSRFTLDFEYDGRPFIFSTLSTQSFELPYKLDKAFYTADEIQKDGDLAELAGGYFLVPEDMDESVFYLGISNMMKAYFRKKYHNAYTILPTLACNARCVYCYEEGIKPVTMTDTVIENTIAYITRTHRKDGPVVLQWFGGEPLLNVSIIDRIADGLLKNGVEFVSSIVTNGSLIDEALADRMVDKWKLKKAQISFDGAEADYINRKRYVKYDDTYHKVLKNAAMLAQRGAYVILRCNVDLDNIGDMPHVMEDLAAALSAIGQKDNFSVYFAPLNQARESEDIFELQRRIDDARSMLEAHGLKGLPPVVPYMHFRIFRCMADDPTGSVVILPDGRLCTCLQPSDDSIYGDVANGITKPEVFNKYAVAGPVREKCRACVFLPSCTAFSLCPVANKLCYDQRIKAAADYLPKMARMAESGTLDESANPEERDITERINELNEFAE